MEPMKPMQPMKPMEPMTSGPSWWPDDLGQPSSSGGQNDMHYAFFPDSQRLAIQQGGKVTIYDSGDHRINGVSQSSGGSPEFTSQNGTVDVSELKQVK